MSRLKIAYENIIFASIKKIEEKQIFDVDLIIFMIYNNSVTGYVLSYASHCYAIPSYSKTILPHSLVALAQGERQKGRKAKDKN